MNVQDVTEMKRDQTTDCCMCPTFLEITNETAIRAQDGEKIGRERENLI